MHPLNVDAGWIPLAAQSAACSSNSRRP